MHIPQALSLDQNNVTLRLTESRISAGATEKLPGWKSQTQNWFYDMEGHARKCVERYGELANKKVEQLYKVSSPCLDDHQFKQEELASVWRIVRNLLKNCLVMLVFGTNWET